MLASLTGFLKVLIIMKSKFFSNLFRLRWIKRWGLMRNSYEENVMEHSWEVAVIAHTLAVIRNQYFGGQVDANAITVAALFHDATEVITGDLPTPIKYHSVEIESAYKHIEGLAAVEICNDLSENLQPIFLNILNQNQIDDVSREIIKTADKISAFIKTKREVEAGNKDYEAVSHMLLMKIREMCSPEADYFLDHFHV